MKTIGLCLGATRISQVVAEVSGTGTVSLLETACINHNGDVIDTLNSLLGRFGTEKVKIAVTGRKFRNQLEYPTISEGEAVEFAFNYLQEKYHECDTIISAGGEAFIGYKLDGQGKICDVVSGNKCASGTGEFFLQQLKRMNLTVDQAMSVVEQDNPYPMAGRCSVFCKSDCTHALNKGEPKSRVVSGLCKMMAGKILELSKKCRANKLLLIGGTANNKAMVEFVRRGLDETSALVVADETDYFEALGAAIWGGAAIEKVCAADNFSISLKQGQSSFAYLPALKDADKQVAFNTWTTAEPDVNDRCIVGLDVGSTTTKAVVMRERDNAVLASVYLRTNGDPVQAARNCYQDLASDLKCSINIAGVGVTGSGRQLAGLHAGTEGIVNEIIAHATAAIHFDPEVDTIFEIGGQDAKYTFVTNRVPADYAMNEACSAGTGSFLEEAAHEAMGVDHLAIADLALRSTKPPNFSDQCSAFIGSDIKNAIQEGIPTEDILAGLVYSICQNYLNRVVGNRPIGKKVFMQGGVCYNRAVPIAMATIAGKKIVVPPEPGLMGAYGVALEIKRKLEQGLIKEKQFDLLELAKRQVTYGKPFTCNGGSDRCDRKCRITMTEIDGTAFPFGGACNKYVNLRRNVDYDVKSLDFVAKREDLMFEAYAGQALKTEGRRKIGLTKALLTNSLFPLYYNFFSRLGLEVVLADQPDTAGIEKTGAAFCYPVELAHGMTMSLLKQEVDFVFLPQITGIPVENGSQVSVVCPLVQGEPYYLKASFKELQNKIISPILDFTQGFDQLANDFIKIGSSLGVSRASSKDAYWAAVDSQCACVREMKRIGDELLARIDKNQEIGVVLFGRPYNAFSKLANMGIAHKFASRGILVLPWDYLPHEGENPFPSMFWAMGQMILKAAKLVKRHPRLFAAYITNFSCGPDSFIISYFREIMGTKPALVLELDAHTADAGLDTRIEAFLDIVDSSLKLKNQQTTSVRSQFQPTVVQEDKGELYVLDSAGVKRSFSDPKVKLIVPAMGLFGSRLLSAALRYAGYNSSYLDPPGSSALSMGRANCSCKECLPYMLVSGSVLEDIQKREKHDTDEVLIYFFPDSSGPCRLGQYHVALRQQLEQHRKKNVAIMTLSSDNGYVGFNSRFHLRAWQAIIIADILSDIHNSLLVLAQDKRLALETLNRIVHTIEIALTFDNWAELKSILADCAREIAAIPLCQTFEKVPKVSLLGEIFVRVDPFSRQGLVERLAESGIVTKVAPISEFIYSCDYLLQRGLYHVKHRARDKVVSSLKGAVKRYFEMQIKKIMAQTKLFDPELIDIPTIMANAAGLVSPKFTAGETVLTVGSVLASNPEHTNGILSLGPFGCMPNRVAEAILSQDLSGETGENGIKPPVLSLETDGTPFPPLTEAKLELFCLRVTRQKSAWDTANFSRS